MTDAVRDLPTTVSAAAINPALAGAVQPTPPTGDLPQRAQVVVVGGGVIGTSTAYHLTKLGVRDVVLLERQQLTSGTTWHAAGLIASGGQTSETFAWMSRYARDLYAGLEAETGLSTGFTPCGYLQLATTPRRLEAYRRETAFLTSVMGIEKHELSRDEVAAMVPMLDPRSVLAGFYTPDEGRANPVDVAMSMAKGARMGGARIVENTAATGFTVTGGRVTGVVTDRGTIETETVVLCAGLWGRELAATAGVTVPLQAAEHYYLLTEPMAGAESLPVVEEPERYGYYREEGGGMLVGLFEPVAAPWALDGAPADFAFGVLPPDWDRLEPFLERAMGLFPALADAGIKTLFCGPESFTPDLGPNMGLAPELDGFYVACGLNSVGILLGGGVGHVMAQWVVDGAAPVDTSSMHVDRALPWQTTRRFRAERTVEMLGGLLNDSSWPNHEWQTGRDVRQSILHSRFQSAGAEFGASFGWEYPLWFAAPGTRPTVEWGYGRNEGFHRTADEHRATREDVVGFDMTLMSKYLVQGRDALALLDRVCVSSVDVPVGRIVYTNWVDERGLLLADLTVTRLAEDRFLVVASDVIHRRVAWWLARNTPADAHVVVTDVTSGTTLLSVQGPRSRELIGRLTPADLSNDAFPYLTAQQIELGYARVLALRVTYVGELGWELHIPTEFAPSLYDQLVEAGSDLGFRPAGMNALSTTRLEKAYRDYAHDIDNSDNPYEVGLGFTVDLGKQFVGRDALARIKEQGSPRNRLVQFLLDDPEPLLYHAEPVLRDGACVGYMRSGGYGHTLGGAVGLGQVQTEEPLTADAIAASTWEIDVAGVRVPATASLRPLFDPDRTRPRS